MFLKDDLSLFNELKEYCTANFNNDIAFNLDILYKWVWNFGFYETAEVSHLSKIKSLVKFFISSEIYMYKNYNLNTVENIETDVLIPYLFPRLDYLDLILPSINILISKGYKITFLSTKMIYSNYLKSNVSKNIKIIYWEDYVKFSDYLKVTISVFNIYSDFLKMKKVLNLNLYELIKLKEYFIKFYFEKYIFDEVLNSTKPKLMFGIHYELNRGILKSFLQYKKENKLENILIQHGIFDTDYGFSEGFGSDLYILWGKYSEEVKKRADTYNIIKSPPLIVLGNPKIEQLLKDYKMSRSNKKCKIIFVSTPKLPHNLNHRSIELFAKMVTKYNMEHDYEIIYKLHPAEDLEDYRVLIEKNLIKNNQLIRNINIFDLIEDNSVVLGTVSTVLIEVVALGIPVIQLFSQECETLNFDLEKGGIKSPSNIKELYTMVNKIVTDYNYRNLILENESELIKYIFGNTVDVSEKIAELLMKKMENTIVDK